MSTEKPIITLENLAGQASAHHIGDAAGMDEQASAAAPAQPAAQELCKVCKGLGRYQDGDSGTDADGRAPNIVDCDCADSERLPHPDDAAVDRFAAAMKAKLAKAREKGRGGWDDPAQCSVEFLAALLVEHLGKGNAGTFEDVANLAMMLHQRDADPNVLADAAAQDQGEVQRLRVQVCKLGRHGAAFDPASTHYAYTYADQPDNVGAMKLGRAALAVKPGGDEIDAGLSLLDRLSREGFGVFQIAASTGQEVTP